MDFVSVFVGFVSGCAFYAVLNWEVNRRVLSALRRQANSKGREAQIQYADERAAALAEAVAIYQGAGTNAEKLKQGAALLVKYPSSAAWLVKQFRTFQKEGITGLIDAG